ncbi:hypothetical protein [Limimaricola cinnabarinus]|uniref:Uncharacterized protein n=1 Tax=Limimaricola cinnabarinus LL-001 TaxID=1337093 RepID=U3AR42_9RHOB|nr:hypothetical protein [Limimaricola cinnabarinus]GAD57203.1 hypothetical protein MBELCI_3255 [Limimaricola cinnabarinus LL-001]
MGLDTGFLTLGAKVEIAYLRDHRGFSNLLSEQDPKPYCPGYTDFLVDTSMIDIVAARLPIEAACVVRAEARMPRPSSTDICWMGEQNQTFVDLLPAYRRVIRRLRNAAAEPHPLLCAWSA